MLRSPLLRTPAAAAVFDFNSHPADVALVNTILRPWVERGVRTPGTYAHTADLYSAEPSDLARRFRAAVDRNGERAWYFLSPLRTKSPRGRRKARTVAGGAGWWHGEAGPKPVLDNLAGGRQVGYRQSFSFMRRGDDGVPVRTGWIMVELRLHDDDDEDGGGFLGDQLEGLVLCKVYRSPRHPDTAAANDGQDESCAATTPPGRCVVVVDDYGSSDAPVVSDDENEMFGATTPAARGDEEEKKVANDENESSGATMAAARAEEGKKAADDENENSGATMAAARADKEEKKVPDDVDSSASTPATRKRARTADDEGPARAASVRKKMAAGAPAATQQHLHCPECGFHLGALQAVLSPAKSTSETETKKETETGIALADAQQGVGTGGASGSEDRSSRRFF